jgi:hypothetical protein
MLKVQMKQQKLNKIINSFHPPVSKTEAGFFIVILKIVHAKISTFYL